MPNYDFKSLSSFDFELLVRDLLQRHLSIHLESFKPGKDKGIDLRYATESTRNEIIVQCKHYANSPFSTLLSAIKNEESQKVATLKPKRYILVTSQGLTPGNKASLATVLTPICVNESDIFGADDLNNLITQYPEVEKNHFKLWLFSTHVLERVFHAKIFNQSAFELDAIRRKMGLYVQGAGFIAARQILDSNHFCIISGIPGIGKTTLAEMLLVDHVSRDYEAIKISESLSEGIRAFDSGKKQIFYYDDFLGQIQLGDQLKKNEDDLLLRFFDYVSRSPLHRFILTTREHILQQARQNYEKLGLHDWKLSKCLLQLNDYSVLDRGKILFNHLAASNLESDYIDELLHGRRYAELIRHHNFSPRIVEWMTTQLRYINIVPSQYFNCFKENLDSPATLWRHAFEKQISNAARALVLVTFSLPNDVFIDDVETAFTQFFCTQAEKYGWARGTNDFRNALKETDGTFIASKRKDGRISLSLNNPSIRDFIRAFFRQNFETAKILARSAHFFYQIPAISMVLDPHTNDSTSPLVVSDSDIIDNIHRIIGRDVIRFGDRLSWITGNFESDLIHLLNATEKVDGERRARLLVPLIKRLENRTETGSSDRASLVSCCAILEKHKELYFGRRSELVEAVSQLLVTGLESWSDCYQLARWRDLVNGFERDPRYIAASNGVRDVLARDAEVWIDSLDDPAELKSVAEDITMVGNMFSIDVSNSAGRLEKRADIREEEIRDGGCADVEQPDEIGANNSVIIGEDDEEIDAMFALLRGRSLSSQ